MSSAECSGRTLAFLGDAVWSYIVRRHLVSTGQGNGKNLQKKAVSYESAKAQAEFYRVLHEEGFFHEEEEEVFRRGRNDHSSGAPHNTSVQIYRYSTGFEAILGYLQLEQNWERIEEIWDKVKTMKEG